MIKNTLLVFAFVLISIKSIAINKQVTLDKILIDEKMTDQGKITKISSFSFDETYEKLRTIIENNPNLKIILELDHQANAKKVDLDLPPTKIIMFGNPKLGTPLMSASISAGLDLPQKILVTERNGKVYVIYNDPMYLKERHSIEEKNEVLEKITNALDTITTKATQL